MTSAPYISWIGHGAANLAPPATFTAARMSLFSVAASTAAMQHLADALLNPVAAGKMRYVPALPTAIFSFSDCPTCTSQAEPIGWSPGREAMILLPLWEFEAGNLLPNGLVFWMPYVFIDYTIGLVTGREIWGWPKVLARIGVDTDAPGADFSCETTIFPTLAPTTQARNAVLYRVVKTHGSEAQSPWADAADAARGAVEGLLGGLAEDVVGALALQPRIACVVVKQFRASHNPKICCYQAIVNSPIAVTGFHGGGPLHDRFAVDITGCESHAIVFDLLGTKPAAGITRLPVTFALAATVDYAALPGSDIIVAT